VRCNMIFYALGMSECEAKEVRKERLCSVNVWAMEG
jgi:hypothetical protein